MLTTEHHGARLQALLRHANDGVKVIEAFECFPVMTPAELALRIGIANDEAARYLSSLEKTGLACTDGEYFWLDTSMPPIVGQD